MLLGSLRIIGIILEFEVEPEMYGAGGDRLMLHYWWSRLGSMPSWALIQR